MWLGQLGPVVMYVQLGKCSDIPIRTALCDLAPVCSENGRTTVGGDQQTSVGH